MAQNKERRNHLTFQEKLIILKERQDTPSKPVRQIVAVYTVLDACIIATVKNRYKAWLNKLPIDEFPCRWIKIKKFVEYINTTGKETILKGWEKTKLSDGFDLDELMENQDFEEEFLLSEKMAELMLEDECEKEDLND